MKKASLADRLAYAVAWIHGRSDLRPVAGVVLGSGLGRFAESLEKATLIPYGEIPEFPTSSVPGHAGRMVVGELPSAGGPVPVAVLQGRVHGYEGFAPDEVAFGVRVLGRLGISSLWLTNAAGGVNPAYQPGDLVRITDHLNLTGQSPLTGPNPDLLGPRFPDMNAAYDPALGALLEEEARRLGMPLAAGVYAGLSGPSYETPAEIRMLARLGADLVGMSTVHEVIAARHMGLRTAALSLVTNRAAGLSPTPLTHDEVQRVGAERGEQVARLLAAAIPRAR
ncbi:MAG: purine-nucleoside phosphorylase [Deltaproteobacteria bacterium]|nr:purine-nucleoside phosphorylase [Deltaproteobacteria bacterium]